MCYTFQQFPYRFIHKQDFFLIFYLFQPFANHYLSEQENLTRL